MNVNDGGPEVDSWRNIRRWMTRHPYWTLTIITLVLLGPFVAKPFNIDDPLFILAAHQIQHHPTNPYGFTVEWDWRAAPMYKATDNPPLTCYYLAVAAAVVGWSEVALHSVMLLPAVAVILGTYRLARRLCRSPMLATLMVLFTPVFLVSSLTVMCDISMLAFWLWAVIFWIEGTQHNKPGWLWLGALLIVLSELSKYFGVCLVPLLGAYSIASKRSWKQWLPCLLVPPLVLVAYHFGTLALYGHSSFGRALDCAIFTKEQSGWYFLSPVLIALAFTGGCMAMATFFSPFLWGKRTLLIQAGAVVVLLIVVLLKGDIWKISGLVLAERKLSVAVQMGLWAMGGWSLVALAISEMRRHWSPESILLGLWILGTFIFLALLNWTVNARTALPMAPAAGLLIARRLNDRKLVDFDSWSAGIKISLGAGLLVSLAVLQGDYLLAVATRNNAEQVCEEYKSRLNDLWFQGHWGFQYYMNAAGAKALDFKSSPVKTEDIMAVPSNNTNILPPSPKSAVMMEILKMTGPWMVTTCKPEMGAGFYASSFGPLPFVFGAVPPETVSIYLIKPGS